MRLVLLAALCALASPAMAETWITREGECGEWQARWDVIQETNGVWVGQAEYLHVGGPCAEPTGEIRGSDVRAVIAGSNLFAVRGRPGGGVCTYVMQIGANRGRGFSLCEGQRRSGVAMRFRAGDRQGSLREMVPERELWDREQGSDRGGRFQREGIDDWFDRR